jgi:hypothetical protein
MSSLAITSPVFVKWSSTLSSLKRSFKVFG